MLSSFTQFLPQALQQNINNQPQSPPETDTDEGHEPTASAAPNLPVGEPAQGGPPKVEGAKRRRDKKSSTMHETFIIVRPPPSKSNHPLNLQVQLVPPAHARDASNRSVSGGGPADPNQSSDTINDQNPAAGSLTLQRTASGRSNRSNVSFYSAPSLASVTSLASSNTSTSSGKRRIVPLYNLSAHNVITNTVTDAGTDAKVAKFSKRGIEVLGLGVLEGYEVRTVAVDPSAHNPRVSLHLPDDTNRIFSPPSSSNGHSLVPSTSITTPSSSTSHLSSSDNHVLTATPSTPVSADKFTYRLNSPSTPTQQNSNSAKKLFGKLFRKKDGSNTTITPSVSTDMSPPATLSPPVSSPSSSFFNRSSKNRTSMLFGRTQESPVATTTPMSAPATPTPDTPTPTASGPVATTSGVVAQAPVLGTQTTLVTRYIPIPSSESPPADLSSSPTNRSAHSYEWVIRRWIKGNDEGWLGNVLNTATSGVFPTSGASALVEVRFEWTRGRGSRVREREKRERDQRRKLAASEGGASGLEVPGDGRRERPVSMALSPSGEQGLASKVSQVSLNGSSIGPGAGRRKPTVGLGAGRPMSLQAPPKNLPSFLPSQVLGKQPSQDLSANNARSPSPSSFAPRPSMDSSSRRSSSGSGSGGGGPGATSHTRAQTHDASLGKRKSRSKIRGEDDDGEESDPEDSETPWMCTLWIGPPPSSFLAPSGSSPTSGPAAPFAPLPIHGHPERKASVASGASLGGPKTVKMKLATLTPAPHHPKVVSQLKMPFPLSGVDVANMELIPAEGARERESEEGNAPSAEPNNTGTMTGIILTPEEIKDVVCVTGLWVMVREGFGGLDRKRKGDGWRIRG